MLFRTHVSKFLKSVFSIVVGAVLVAGMGSCGGHTIVPPAQSFSVSATPAAVQVVAGSSTTISVTINAQNGFSSPVQVTASGLPAGVTVQPNSITLTPGVAAQITLSAGAGSAAASSNAVLTAVYGSVTQTASVAVSVLPAPDFALSVSAPSVSLVQGGTVQAIQVLATALNGFSGSVNVVLGGLPTGVSASPATVVLTPGVAQTVTLTASASATVGSANAVVTATYGGTTHTAALGVNVAAAPDFSLSVTASSVSLVQGATGQTVQVLATALNGFSGSVNIGLSGLPTGVSASPATVVLTPGVAQTVTLTASASAAVGSVSGLVTGTSGSLTHTVPLGISVAPAPDFSLSLSPQSLNLNQAQAGQTFQITATALNGFTGNVSVAMSNLPTGVSASAANFTLTPGVAQTVTLTAAAAAVLGTGSATLTANGGANTHASTLGVTVYLAGIMNGPFVHPGILHSQADLDRMKTKVAAGVEPYKTEFAAYASEGYSSYTNTGQGPFVYETYNHGQFEIRNDAQVAHQNAIMWYITGDVRYRDNAIAIMMAWANTMTAFDVTDVLTAGTCIRDFANAGEIIRATGNGAWAPAQITQFQNWMMTLIYPALLYGSTIPPLPTNPTFTDTGGVGPAGFGGLQMAGFFALGVFCDRADIYNFAVAAYQHHTVYSYGLTEYIDVSGQNYENQRDIGHSSGNLGTFAQNAYVVLNQGQDIFQFNNNLLAKAFESQAKWDMGWDVAPVAYQSADGHLHDKMSADNRNANGQDNLAVSLMYSIFHGVKGLNLPYTKMSSDLQFGGSDSLYFRVDDTGLVPVTPLVGVPAPTGVELFEDSLGGSYDTNLPAGIYNHAALLAAGMERYGSGPVSSLRLPIGWTVIACNGDNLTGQSITVTGTAANQGIILMTDPAVNFNDELYSMQVIAGALPYPIWNDSYELINLNSGKAAEIAGASIKAGAAMDQSTETTAQRQLWSVQGLAHGQFSIINMNSNLALEAVAGSGAGGALDQQTFVPSPDLASGGTASASTDNAANGEGAAQAFDGSVNTKWNDVVNGGTGWLQYRLPAAAVVDTYIMTSANDVQQRDPANWQFLGSNDGTNWTTLDTQTGQAFANRYQAITYSLTNTQAYSYYRLNITANQGGSGYSLQLSELGLFSSLSGAANQRWKIAAVPNTTIGSAFTIVNVGTGLAMDVSGSSQSDGAAVVQTGANGSASQKWALQIPSLLLP